MNAGSYPASPRADFLGALAWIAFGAHRRDVVADGPLRRAGRAAHLSGLWPGLVGDARRAGRHPRACSLGRARSAGWQAGESDDTEIVAPSRFALGAGLFFVYALLLVGRGLPFWLGTALFVTAFVFLFQRAQRIADGRAARGIVVALVCGGATAAAVTVVFEQLFLVRLP
jgi:putative tricarboxylic transport membrane protein